MSSITTFPTRVELFTQNIVPDVNVSTLRDHFSRFFPYNYSFTKEEVLLFVNCVRQQITKEKTAKTFSMAISTDLVKKIFKFNKLQIEQSINDIPESLRAYIALRYCAVKDLDANEIVLNMRRVAITSERLRYKFAIHAAKRHVADFTNEVTDFQLKDVSLIRRLAEVALYFDTNAFFSELKKFGFLENKVREEFYLRGLVRSVGVVEKLLEDDVFLSSLENFSTKVLEFIYEQFSFGRTAIQEAIRQAKNPQPEPPSGILKYLVQRIEETPLLLEKKANSDDLSRKKEYLLPENEASSVFALFIKKAGSPLYVLPELGFKSIAIFDHLNDNERQALLAMLLLIKSLDDPELAIQSEVLLFLKEINSFPDPAVRFAVVALALIGIKNGRDLINQLSHSRTRIELNSYPKIYSLILYTCDGLCPNTDYELLHDKWKNIYFRKNFIRFLAELFFLKSLRIVRDKKSYRNFLVTKICKNRKCSLIFLCVLVAV